MTPAVTRYSITAITAGAPVTAKLQENMRVQALHQLQRITAVFRPITAAVMLQQLQQPPRPRTPAERTALCSDRERTTPTHHGLRAQLARHTSCEHTLSQFASS